MLLQSLKHLIVDGIFSSLGRPKVLWNHNPVKWKVHNKLGFHEITTKLDLYCFVKYPALYRNAGKMHPHPLLNLVLFLPFNAHLTVFIIIVRILHVSLLGTLHSFVFTLAVLETLAWLCVNEVEVTWEYFLLVKDRQNVNIKLPSSPRKGSICQFCTEPTAGTLGYGEKQAN